MSYQHLTIEERACIAQYLKNGLNQSQIAALLHRDRSTISREIRRNQNCLGKYTAIGANRKYHARRKAAQPKPKLVTDQELYGRVLVGLQLYFSPEQIINTLLSDNRVSVSTIYRAVSQKLFPKIAAEKLRRYHKKKKKSDKRGTSYDFSKVRTIQERPASVLSKEEFGHWELDTIVLYCGKNGYLAVMVERKTKYTIVLRLPDKKATTMTDAVIAALGQLPDYAVKSLTVDRGLEFTDWERLEKALGTTVYFCDPYSPEQKPIVENTNGLLRQFYPRRKNSDFSFDPQLAAALLNCRPRKVLDWRSASNSFLLHLD